MPAVALSPLAIEEAVQESAAAPHHSPTTLPEDFQWRHVERDFAGKFAGTEELEQAIHHRKSKSKRHRPFSLNSSMAAVAVVLCELLGLVWLHGIDLQAWRQSDDLNNQIALTNESIARTQKAIAANNSSPHLQEWATQLGYHQADVTDFDDATQNSPMPAPPAKPGAEVDR